MNKLGVIIKTTIILFLITSVSALLLAFVNEKTAPLIEQNESIKQSNALQAIMPDASDFEPVEADDEMKDAASEYKCEINNVYVAKNASGETEGVCSILTTSGYDSGLQIAVGVDNDKKVTDIQIISSNETPGLGQNASKPEFKDQFKGKDTLLSVVKSGAKDEEINAISGATLTSNGVTRIVNSALKIAEIKEGN